jgi:putative transposase
VDQEGVVLDSLVQERRNGTAAERFSRRVRDGCGPRPRVVIPDKRASYPPAIRRVLPAVEHWRHQRLHNRAEHSHRPMRRRAQAMQRFTSPEPADRVLACCEPIRGHCCPRRHVLPAARERRAGHSLRGVTAGGGAHRQRLRAMNRLGRVPQSTPRRDPTPRAR